MPAVSRRRLGCRAVSRRAAALRYFEDFHPGQVIELGSRTVTEAEIIAFARNYDPQYFHTDPAAAAGSVWGGLVASGWHTSSLFMRLLVDGLLHDVASLASPGVDDIRWLRPVRPGDVLHGRITIVEMIPSRRGAGRGTCKHLGELFNQRDELVMTVRPISLIGCRPPRAAD
jgi:acyl dehydratase